MKKFSFACIVIGLLFREFFIMRASVLRFEASKWLGLDPSTYNLIADIMGIIVIIFLVLYLLPKKQ